MNNSTINELDLVDDEATEVFFNPTQEPENRKVQKPNEEGDLFLDVKVPEKVNKVPYGRVYEPGEQKQYISNIQGFIDPTKKIEPWQETILENSVTSTPFSELTLSYIGKLGLLLPDLIDKGFDEFILEPDPNFKPTELSYYNDPTYANFKNLFLGAKAESHADNIKFRIDHQLHHQELTSNAGWWKNMMAGMASEVFNPLNYVFAGRAVKESYNILHHGLYWAGVNMGLAGLTETADQLTSEVEKPLSESFINVTASGMLGLLGGVSGIGITRTQLARNSKNLEKALITNPELEAKGFTIENFNEFNLGLKANMGPFEANKIIKAFSKMALVQTAYSDNPVTRNIATDLFEMGLSEGKIASLTTIKRWQSKYIGGSKDILKEHYTPWLESQNKNTASRKALSLLNFDKQFSLFDAEVDKAMRVGDIHENPHVQSCARELREIKNELVLEGLQPEVDIFGIHAFKISEAKSEVNDIKSQLAEYRKEYKNEVKGLRKGTEERQEIDLEYEAIFNVHDRQLNLANEKLQTVIDTPLTLDELKTQYAESHATRIFDTKKIRKDMDGFRDFVETRYYADAQARESYIDNKKFLETRIERRQKLSAKELSEIEERIDYHIDRSKKISDQLDRARKPERVLKLQEQLSKKEKTIKNFRMKKERSLRAVSKARLRLERYEKDVLDRSLASAKRTVLKLSKVPGDSISSIDYHQIGKPGITQKRLLAISDVDLSPWLVHSATLVLNKEMRSLIPAIVLKKKFGSASVQGSLNKIAKWADDAVIRPGITEKQRNKIIRQRDEDMKNIEVGWNRARGISPIKKDLLNNRGVITAIRTSRNITTALKAGSFTFNVLQDLPNQIQFFGLKRTFSTHLKMLRSKILDKENIARDHKMLKSFGLANDTALSMREELINDMLYGIDQNAIELTTHGLASLEFKASLINNIDEYTRMVSDYAMMDKIKGIVLSKNLKEADVQWMLDVGIAPQYFPQIRDNIIKYGETEGKLKFANIDQWDKETANVVADSMKKLETQTIILPSAGDLPRSFDNPVLGTFMLFKSFIFAATQKLMIPALQRPTLATVSALIVGWGMGMFQEVVRSVLSGREIPDWEELAFKGFKRVDQFGAVPWIWDIIQTAVGFGDTVKYGKSLASDIVGAPISVINDTQKVVRAQHKRITEDKPFTDSDKNALRKMIPFADLWYTRYATTKLLGIDFPSKNKEEAEFHKKTQKRENKKTNSLPRK